MLNITTEKLAHALTRLSNELRADAERSVNPILANKAL